MMHTYQRPLGRISAVSLPLCLALASACSDEATTEVPLDTILPPLSYTLDLAYDEDSYTGNPETLTGHLYLDIDAEGRVSGVISTKDTGVVRLSPLTGRVEGNAIAFDPDSAAVSPEGWLAWDQFRITLRDSDGDGQIDGAQGRASGDWYRIIGDIGDGSAFTSVLTAGLDTRSTTASLSVAPTRLAPLPFDPLRIRFEEPLAENDVRAAIRILAEGTPVPGELTFDATGGLVTEATFVAATYLPFDADVTLDLGNLEDPAGNGLIASNDLVSMVPDPGPLGGNTGFETNLTGWSTIGEVSTQGAVDGFAPAEGALQAVVREDSTLAGYFDVPADANELDFSVILLPLSSSVVSNYTTVIALHAQGGERIEILDIGDFEDQLQLCDSCTEFNFSLGPLRRTVNLTSYRGQRVFLTVDARASSGFFTRQVAVLIDDLQIR